MHTAVKSLLNTHAARQGQCGKPVGHTVGPRVPTPWQACRHPWCLPCKTAGGQASSGLTVSQQGTTMDLQGRLHFTRAPQVAGASDGSWRLGFVSH